MRPCVRSGNRMRLARIELQVIGQVRVDQLLDELDGVLQMHIVVARAMYQQQPPVQLVRIRHHGEVAVLVGILRRLTHVALGVGRVVVPPIGHRRHSNPCLEAVRVGHRIEREGAAPTPSPPALPLRVQFGKLRQHLVHRAELVLKLNGPEVVIRGLFEVAPAPAHAAVVYVQYGESMLRQHLIEERHASLPRILDRLGMRSAIGIVNQWHAAVLVRTLWQHQAGVERQSHRSPSGSACAAPSACNPGSALDARRHCIWCC